MSCGTRVPFRSPNVFVYGAFTLYGRPFQSRSTDLEISYSAQGLRSLNKRSHDPHTATLVGLHSAGLGSSAFARHYLRNHCCFLFLRVLRCFSSPGSLTPAYIFSGLWPARAGTGFPIRISAGYRLCSGSPQLFAATYVLLRLSTPRHPPRALSSLTSLTQIRLLSDLGAAPRSENLVRTLLHPMSMNRRRPEACRTPISASLKSESSVIGRCECLTRRVDRGRAPWC